MARNTALTGLRTFVRFGVAIEMLPVLIDRLGADRTGLFLFATTLTGYFTAVELGLATSLTKYVAQFRATGLREELQTAIRGSALLMSAIGVVIAAALAAVALLAGRARSSRSVD